jgi:anaerobic selenocysteine-containing dehydrogenase
MTTVPTWCRLSECAASLLAEVDDDRLTSIRLDPDGPMGRGAPCGLCTATTDVRHDRILRPRRRQGDRWEETTWEVAIREIGARLKQIRKQSGVRSIATYAGAPVGLSSAGTVRTLAWSLALGSPNLFTPLSTTGGPWLRAVELVLGHAIPLQADVGRAHYVLLLGANQAAQGWGPLQAGRELAEELAHSRKTKGTKLVTADPRRTALAAGADVHLPIRPGTEVFLLLGMVRAVLDNDWADRQYVTDYCDGRDALVDALAPWPVDRCAALCGVPAEGLAGVALKFSRAAMAVVHRSPQALNSVNGTLTAWAMLVLHALTANLLRPGGLYENRGLLDQHALATAFASEGAPRTRVGDFPLLLLQAPGAIFADEVLVPGDDSVRALVCLFGDPARELPGGPRVREALGALDLLVALDVADTETTRLAHWVLPGTHAWERADVHLVDAGILPYRCAQATAPLLSAAGEARDEASFLADLFRAVGPSFRSAFGPHSRLRAGRAVSGDLDTWAADHLGTRGVPPLRELQAAPHGWFGGDVDRATWRVSTPTGRIQLLPRAIREALHALQAPTSPARFDRWLLTSAARDPALRPYDRPVPLDPGVTLHPSAGHAEGARVRVRTHVGTVEAVVHLDEGLRADVVDLPAGYIADVGALIPTDRLDPLAGTAAWNGEPCCVEAL